MHRSAVPELTAVESKDDESDTHPNMKSQNQENTHSEVYNRNEDEGKARDRWCQYDGRRKAWMLSSPQQSEQPYYGGYTVTPKKGYTIIPKMEDWIVSWSSTNDEEQMGYHYLNIHGYYNKETEMGGYGVMVRDSYGKPVTASACVQPEGVSYPYHVLDGVKAGLAFALERKIYDLILICDNLKIDCCLRMIFQRADNGLIETRRIPYKCGFCKTCLRNIIPDTTREESEFMFPLLQDIIDKRDQIMCKSSLFHLHPVKLKLNKAAYLLAEQLVRKTKKQLPRECKPSAEMIDPAAFDNQLKRVLYKDAYEGVRFYQEQQRLLFEKKSQQLQ
ncbi:uncharacterized protein LOC113329628 [Papaver somniferum]|uniref:uncharacterized protein LOC113329628 n=1 Tax=Papaver somniferum TaxID=3469 RepID=UPI000E7044BD|nr:uncharacterized protein LOC113329628 [Papaver somniferum]